LLSNLPKMYLSAMREEPSLGVTSGLRPEPTLVEARAELSEAISRIATSLLKDKYGPLLGVVSQPAVNEFLKGFESNLSRTKGDLTLVLEELLDRVNAKNLRRKS
jgi:hypothetical protein